MTTTANPMETKNNEAYEKIRRTLEDEIIRLGSKVDEPLDAICEAYANAFCDQHIVDINADYGSKYQALTLDIAINDGLEFMVRCEKESKPHIVVFSIIRDNVLIYSNTTMLCNFANEVADFCKNRRAIETNTERSINENR